MKFIHTADLHIGKSRKLPGYLDRQDKMLSEIYRAATDFSDGLVVIAGDIYDRLELLPREKDLFVQHLCKADKAGITTVLVSGNHDMIEEDHGGYTHLRGIRMIAEERRLRHTHVFETDPATIVLEEFGVTVIAVPSYYRKTKEVNQIVRAQLKAAAQTKTLQPKVLAVVHETILGARNDFGKKIGIDIGSADHCVELDASLPVTYWALGDVHKPQRIKGCPNAWYCGTPIQHEFGDAGDRGVLVVDLDDPLNPELLELEGVKKLVSFEVTSKTRAKDVPTGAYVRLDGDREYVKALKGLADVVSTKLTPIKEATVIEDVKVSDVLVGLPEVLAEMGISEEDQRWCLDEAERLR